MFIIETDDQVMNPAVHGAMFPFPSQPSLATIAMVCMCTQYAGLGPWMHPFMRGAIHDWIHPGMHPSMDASIHGWNHPWMVPSRDGSLGGYMLCNTLHCSVYIVSVVSHRLQP